MRKLGVGISTIALVATLLPATVIAAGEGITINEIRIDQPGGDDDEYFELSGTPGAELDPYAYVVIGDGTGGSGAIEAVVEFADGHAIGSSGMFVVAESTFSLGTADLTTSLNFENSDNVTHMLVSGFTGAVDDDLDTDDDGTLDVTPWSEVLDSVSLVESHTSGEAIYSPIALGPDGGRFVPGHAYDCPVSGWIIGDFTVGVTDTPGEQNSPCPEDVKIHQIQGNGFASPRDGDFVSVEGVVVGDFQGTEFAGDQLDGFFIQEEPGDQDTGPEAGSTSEGIFVYGPNAIDVSIGDVVRASGTVDEFHKLTEITSVAGIHKMGMDPDSVIATNIELPISSDEDFEKVEGMLVTLTQELVISEFFNFDRTGEIVLTTDRQYQGTHLAEPGPAANAVASANALARVTLDDGRFSQNPDPAIHPNGSEFTLSNTFRGGDTVQNVIGVMSEGRPHAFTSFVDYRIHPTDPAEYSNENLRPTSPDPIDGDLRVATFNVLNFFTHLDNGPDNCGPTGNLECRGADNADEYRRQLDKLVAGIIALDADVVGIQEIENDIRTGDGDRAHDPVLTLVDALNMVDGPGTWSWVGEANHYNDYPVRNEIIYKNASVVPDGDPVAYANDAFDLKRPGDIEPVGRPPLAQVFRPAVDRGRGGQKFAVVVNHFKSKGSPCDSIGDPDTGDGQANCNLTRVAQAEALLDFVGDLERDVAGVLVIGDLNSYAMEDPIRTLESGGLTDLLEEIIGPDAYTYVFDGQLGYLDYAMATRSMLNWVGGVTSFHINADEPDILDYDTSFKKPAQDALYEPLPYRVSDHDPVIVGIDLPSNRRGRR